MLKPIINMQEEFYQHGYLKLDYTDNNVIKTLNERLSEIIDYREYWKKNINIPKT